MNQKPDERLHLLGTLVRDARRARGFSQVRTAQAAEVSRAQITNFENGGNVSMLFLLKLARTLDVQVSVAGVPLDAHVSSVRTTAALDAVQLLRVADLLAGLEEDLRNLAVEASLPESERGRLNDSLALKEFVSRHVTNERELERLGEMILGTLPRSKSASGQAGARQSSRPKRRNP
jgi:transcriptional regulator with XRE-family HTH domain